MNRYTNDGSSQYAIQNQFTAYLQVAVKRAKVRYLKKLRKIQVQEIAVDTVTLSGDFLHGKIPASFYPNLVDIWQNTENRLYVDDILRQLSELDCKIVRLKILDDLTFLEVAKFLNMEVKTVETRYYRAIKKLVKWAISNNEGGDK